MNEFNGDFKELNVMNCMAGKDCGGGGNKKAREHDQFSYKAVTKRPESSVIGHPDNYARTLVSIYNDAEDVRVTFDAIPVKGGGTLVINTLRYPGNAIGTSMCDCKDIELVDAEYEDANGHRHIGAVLQRRRTEEVMNGESLNMLLRVSDQFDLDPDKLLQSALKLYTTFKNMDLEEDES